MFGGSLEIAMPNFGVRGCSGFLNNRAGECGGLLFKKTLFIFESFDPSVPHVPPVGGKILR